VPLRLPVTACATALSTSLSEAGPDLGFVRPQATVIRRLAPTAPYPNYINNFILMLLNALRVMVILQQFVIFINLVAPCVQGPPSTASFASM